MSKEERARILYRHCKAARLSEQQKKTAQEIAESVVENPHFTPERIRRLAMDIRADENRWGTDLGRVEMAKEANLAIRNPTQRMRKSLTKLSRSHYIILVAMLDVVSPESLQSLREATARLEPELGDQTFSSHLEDLEDTFLRVNKLVLGEREFLRVSWVHPSFRDLLIEELSRDDALRVSFLSVAKNAVSLALSSSGGALGERSLPLLRSTNSWQLVEQRCSKTLEVGDRSELRKLIEILESALSLDLETEAHQRVSQICNTLVSGVENQPHQITNDIGLLEAYLRLAKHLPSIYKPPIKDIWGPIHHEVLEEVREQRLADVYAIEEWNTVLRLIDSHYEEESCSSELADAKLELEHEILSQVDSDYSDISFDLDENPEYNTHRAEELELVLSTLDELGIYQAEIYSRLQSQADEYASHGVKSSQKPVSNKARNASDFNVQKLFEDL